MSEQVIPAPVHDGRRLDWVPRFDPASLDYPMAAGPDTGLPTRGRLWKRGRTLDQGAEGACCGFAAVAEAAAEPVPVPGSTARLARAWYRAAQRRDVWPGEAYDGTSVLATMLEGRARGLYGGFTWAKRAEQLLAGVVDDGPAVAGVEWTEASYSTDARGVLRPGGSVVGGHAVCVIGVVVPGDLDLANADSAPLRAQLAEARLLPGLERVLYDEDAAAIVQNSWGPSFGIDGLCIVPLSVVRGWFAARGEFAQPRERKAPGTRRAAVPDLNEDETPDESEPDEAGTTTEHVTMADVQPRDRILDPPEELGRESVTVRSLPLFVSGRRVRVTTTAGTFTVSAGAAVTVRRPRQ